ncbi:MAG: hypothetical protein E7637_06745 [Ruminococcaceae bacterium]|nr:hypothetical protein [Oscillospiraceae bacterium]
MKTLQFRSDVLEKTDRYSKGFTLPDYLYDAEGNLDRQAMLDVVLREEYGFVNEEGLKTWVEVEFDRPDKPFRHYAGKCEIHKRFRFYFEKNGEQASFPVYLFLPTVHEPIPVVVALNFAVSMERSFLPTEELMERKIGVATVDFNDITMDDNDFSSGIAKLLSDRTDPYAPGKVALWAFAARKIGHYLVDNGYVTPENLYVSGHSRLGKTALLAAAQDTLFAGVLCNNSGCSGAAISRETTGESIERICRNFPFFSNLHYQMYADNEDAMPFDQHYLLALVAPRKLCVIANELDKWADTEAQYLACEAASVAYEKLGVAGLDRPYGGLPPVGGKSRTGNIAFFHCPGPHYLGRDNWHFFIDFIKGENRS